MPKLLHPIAFAIPATIPPGIALATPSLLHDCLCMCSACDALYKSRTVVCFSPRFHLVRERADCKRVAGRNVPLRPDTCLPVNSEKGGAGVSRREEAVIALVHGCAAV